MNFVKYLDENHPYFDRRETYKVENILKPGYMGIAMVPNHLLNFPHVGDLNTLLSESVRKKLHPFVVVEDTIIYQSGEACSIHICDELFLTYDMFRNDNRIKTLLTSTCVNQLAISHIFSCAKTGQMGFNDLLIKCFYPTFSGETEKNGCIYTSPLFPTYYTREELCEQLKTNINIIS